MQSTQIIVLEGGDRIAKRLRSLAESRGAWLRPIRQFASAENTVKKSPQGVFVVHLGRDLERELTVLQTATTVALDLACVVVGDDDHPTLAGLVWDLGAAYALFPPQPLDVLPDVVEGLLAGYE